MNTQKLKASRFKQSNGASNSKDKNTTSKSKGFLQTLFTKIKNQTKEGERLAKTPKRQKAQSQIKQLQKPQKFSLFTMTCKEKAQFRNDLYLPRFENSETFKKLVKVSSGKNLSVAKGDLYQLMRGRNVLTSALTSRPKSPN
mmetsp:Transcript_24360/g.28032  ORF Transcript_24360/g.28032 Transcript_24360/m.28032 type:complete len:142 (-) Transcript_24360:2-427(-)